MGAAGDIIQLVRTRDDAVSTDELADEVIHHLCLNWEFLLDHDDYEESCGWIGEEGDSLLTVDRRFVDQIVFWFDDTVEWPSDVARHRVRMTLLHKRGEFVSLLDSLGYALPPGGGGYPTLVTDFYASGAQCECRLCQKIIDDGGNRREQPTLSPGWQSRLVHAWGSSDDQPTSLVLSDNAMMIELTFGGDHSLLRADNRDVPWLVSCDLGNVRFLAHDPETHAFVSWSSEDLWHIGPDTLRVSRDDGRTWETSSARGLPDGKAIAFVGQLNARTLWAFVRTDVPSLWESRNGGLDWRYLTSPKLGEAACETFATNGEASVGIFTFGEARDSHLAVENGEDWRRIALPEAVEPRVVVAAGRHLACFGTQSDEDGTPIATGCLRSTDNGQSWSWSPLSGEFLRLAAVHPRGPWFVSVVPSREGDDDLFVSYDAGGTWDAVGSVDADGLFFEGAADNKLWVTRKGTLLELTRSR